MKKFFKALALVLALTLVIGTIPAAAATEDYSMKYKTKKLYVGEKRGWKEENGETVYSKYLSKVSYAKAIIGIADKAEAVDKDVTAKSSDKTVVSTHNKAKRIEAEGIGEATVTYYVGGKEVGSILYKVRKSATNDTVYFNRQITEDTAEVIVGTGYEVSLPRSIDKVQQDTDQRRLYAIDKDGNKVDEKKVIITADAEKERLWTVKFVEEGEYTLVGEAYQSDTYPGTNGKATVTVTATKAKPVDVKQTASNMFQIIFDEGVAAGSVIDENTLETGDIYYFIPNTEAAAPFSLIKKTEIKDNIVTVTMFQDFVSGTEYFVDAAGKVFSFVGTGTGLKDVDTVVITKTSVPSGKNTDLGIKIYNKLGIEITNAINADAVSVEIVTGDDATMVSATEILFEEAGKSVVAKASVFIGYDEANDYKEIIVASEPTPITSYNGAAVSTGSKDSITADPSKYIGKDSTETKWFAIGDTAYLQTITLMSEGDPKDAVASGYEMAKSADENICVVAGYDATTGINNVKLVGIKAGTTQIVYYKADANGNMNAVHAATVTVKAKRVASSIDAKFSQALLNVDNAADKVTLEVTVKDQYDALFEGATIVVTQNKNNENANGKIALAGGKTDAKGSYKLDVTKATFDNVGTLYDSKSQVVKLDTAKQYLYDVKIDGTNLTKTVRFTAQAAGTAASGYTLNVSELALDTSVLLDTEAKTSVITVSGTKNGYKTGDMDLKVVDKAPVKGDAWGGNSASSTAIYVIVKDKDGKAVSESTVLPGFYTSTAAELKITNLIAGTTVTGGAVVKKLATGSYTVSAYSVEKGTDGKIATVKNLGTKTIKVTDSQVKPAYVKLKDTGATVAECFEFTFNGAKTNVIQSGTAGEPVPVFSTQPSSNDTAFVYNAKVYVKLNKLTGMYLESTVDINKVVTVK